MMRAIWSGNVSMRGPWLLIGAVGLLLYSHAAPAVLGETAESISADHMRFKGVLKRSASGPLTTHEISLPDGSSIKEYVNADGVVFAVSWRSRLKPNLEALLGAQYLAAGTTPTMPTGVAGSKMQHSIRRPNLVVHQAGRMNAFGGLAYVPTLVPRGFDAETLR